MTSRRKRAARLIHSRAEPGPAANAAAADDRDPADEDAAADGDGLESGIAEVFAAIRAAVENGEAVDREAAAAVRPDDPADAMTFRLLGELDRLWQQAA